jgi:TM2 domain-containing membrane protein YozV
MLLSLVVPGLGQFYEGKRFAGALWLFTTLVGYIPFIVPGAVLHLLAIGTAGFRKTSSAG